MEVTYGQHSCQPLRRTVGGFFCLRLMASKLRDLTPEELELRGEAAVLIREHLWLGSKPPPPPHPKAGPWSMGRDLSIWKRLVLLGEDPEALNGAIENVRSLMQNHVDIPLRMTVFYNSAQSGYATPLLEQAKGLWRKRRGRARPKPAAKPAREALHKLLRDLAGP